MSDKPRHPAQPGHAAQPRHSRLGPRGVLALLHLRLWLALLIMAFVPLTVAGATFLYSRDSALPLELVVLVAGTGLALLLIALALSHQVLRRAEELERSRAELHGLYQAARAASLIDALTGLGNHRAFQEELERQLEAHRRYGVAVALLLIDLDDLKLVNDSTGHAAGDDQLREMGRLIGGIARYADRAFRIGGDEFAILMPHTDADGALALGRRLLQQAISEPTQPIPFSGGVSACPALASDREQLYAQADAALYWSKRHGRAAIEAFDPARDRDPRQLAAGGQTMGIARVIGQRLLRAVYQPVVDLRTGTVVGFEGLIRPLPQSGFADPGALFAAAETAGRTVELDHACLAVILAQGVGLSPAQRLGINLSPRTIEAPNFSAAWLLARAARHGLSARQLVVELTEHDTIEDLVGLRHNLAALQQAGVHVAIDDVGAGNAGLRMLSQFRFDIVKIDLSLVHDGTLRDSSRAVVSSLSELAGRWSAYVVAEGLETVGQLRAVRELGIAAGQGFIFGRPTPQPSLARVDLANIEAGGVTMQAHRQPAPPEVRPLADRDGLPASRPGTL